MLRKSDEALNFNKNFTILPCDLENSVLNQYDSINYTEFVKRKLIPHMIRLGYFLLRSTNITEVKKSLSTKDIPRFPKLVKSQPKQCIFNSITWSFIQQVFIECELCDE